MFPALPPGQTTGGGQEAEIEPKGNADAAAVDLPPPLPPPVHHRPPPRPPHPRLSRPAAVAVAQAEVGVAPAAVTHGVNPERSRRNEKKRSNTKSRKVKKIRNINGKRTRNPKVKTNQGLFKSQSI